MLLISESSQERNAVFAGGLIEVLRRGLIKNRWGRIK